jgi:hypothetical protein
MPDWMTRTLEPLAMRVGPCAWDAAALLGPDASYVAAHPSLIVAGPDLDETALRAVGLAAGDLPLLLGVHEPEFSRRLPELVNRRVAALGRARVELLVLWVDDSRSLKGGGALQGLFKLREQGVIGHLGLAHQDVREAEWLALHTHGRAILTPYHLADQAARYRLFDAAEEHGMVVIATGAWADGKYSPIEPESEAFSLAESARALPILSAPPRDEPAFDSEQAWREYQAAHPAPDPLPRGGPPVGEG